MSKTASGCRLPERAYHILFIGFMGSGKTTVSKLLGEMLSRHVIDVDKLIGTRAPLSDGAFWFDKLYSEHGNNLKVILNP